ncbi:MAG: hypothetical protein JXN59_06660 [Anaerolineae bacterium]|nr:hypothetical protein [Anaerolineae bacterium]
MTDMDPSSKPDFDSFEWDALDQVDLFASAESLEQAAPEADKPLVEAMETVAEQQAALYSEPVVPAPVVPPQAEPVTPRAAPRRRRGVRWKLDPLFAYLVLMGLSFGLTPLASGQPNGRYSILWALLAIVALAARLMDDDRIEFQVNPRQMLWGAGWGLVVGLPLLLVGPDLLADVSHRIFVAVPDGVVFQTIVFVMVTTETAFFRGLMQAGRPASVTAIAASLWSILLFFPTMDVIGYPSLAMIAGTFIVLLNILYSYVRQRNGVAAAWVVQTLVSLAWLFLPRL